MSTFTNTRKLTRVFSFLTVLLLTAVVNIYSQVITPLDTVKTNDSDGLSVWSQAPSINVTGIVTSTKEIGTGTAGPAPIQDSQTGIAVYGNFIASSGGVKIGDSVVVTDVQVKPYNGLTELSYNAGSAVQIISSNHIITPDVITLADFSQGWNGMEKYESMLVTVKNVTFTDSAATFSLNGKTGWSYHITDGKDTIQFRVVKNTPYYLDKPIPKTPVNITGVVSQYCSTAPYNTGYEIFPVDSLSISTATAVEPVPGKIYNYNLYQNYPNPFNPTTTISFSVPSSQKVELAVYNIMGQKVKTLYNGTAPAGITRVNFKADNLSSGVYIYNIKTSSMTLSRKLMLLK